MSDTRIPGIKARHAIITPNCLRVKTDDEAFEEAVDRLRTEFHNTLGNRRSPANYHLVLTVEATK